MATKRKSRAKSGGSKRLRSQDWFNIADNPAESALYIERYLNYGLTRAELQAGKPIIGIAQTGSDLSPCNKIHQDLAERIKAGIRDGGGVPLEFPVHPIQETGKRPTAALDRNLAYLGIVEVIAGYPIDGVVLTTGCDKTTPACLMAAATCDIPSIVLSGGPMLDGHYEGRLAGSGMIVWESRKLLAAGKIGLEEFMERVCSSAPSLGHCNTMGTASSMNSLAEGLGMSLPGCAVIPAPYRERGQMAYATGKRIVGMVREDLRPSKILTKKAFENTIALCSAIGGSTNCPPHINAIARHVGVKLDIADWQRVGYDVPLLVNCQPAGEHLAEGFHLAGGVPSVMKELAKAKKLHLDALTVTGKTVGDNLKGAPAGNPAVIFPYEKPLKDKAGFLVIRGNLFDSAIMKTSVIDAAFRKRYLAAGAFEGRAIVFEGPEDYHARINDPKLKIDENCFLFVRGVGPVGYPGSAEVVNMQPPDALLKKGVSALPTVGDGRQSGTSGSPSILNASPESAIGGGLALLKTGDKVRLDFVKGRLDALVGKSEWARRKRAWKPPKLDNKTPWQELYRKNVGQLDTGGCLEFATSYRAVAHHTPRHSH